MSRGAGRDLLAEERETVLARAMGSLNDGGPETAAAEGADARAIMSVLLDLVVTGEADRSCPPREKLTQIAALMSRNSLSWNTVSVISRALMISAYEHLDGKGDKGDLSHIGRGLLQAQALLFESYLEAEADKRERFSQQLREIDRFPDTIAATLDPPTLTKIGLERMRNMMLMGGAAMYELNASRQLVPVAGNMAGKGADLPGLQLGGLASFTLFEKREPYWEIRGDDVSFAGSTGESGAGCMLLLPMVVRGRTTGVIVLSEAPPGKKCTAEEIELAGRFASRLAVALENAYLHEREQRKIKETVALLEITRAINSTLDLEEILEKVVQMTVDLCGVVMCGIYLYGEETQRFEPSARHGFIEEGDWKNQVGAGFSFSGMYPDQLEILKKGDPVFLAASEAGFLMPADLMCEHGVDMVFLFPLNAKEKLSGVFTLFYPCREANELEVEEVEVVRAIAAQASMAIENAALYEDIEKSYFSTVRALAKAIEVKDPYTHGHSERVTEYALMIAEAMRLEDREKQKLKYAATLHDIGKIGIAGRVLNKPSGLTSEEYTHVKTHPILGESIVEPVEFLQGPRPIILHHHERFDGTGYPQGLKGMAIPLCARILSVADAFEAMRSDRPYRRALPLRTAIEELKRNSGSQFDPEVVGIFLQIIDECGGDPVKR